MAGVSYLHNPLTRILDRNKTTGTDYQVVRFSLAIKFVEVTLRTTNHICHAFQLAVSAFFITQFYLSSKSKGEKAIMFLLAVVESNENMIGNEHKK
jgi:hypothetical protein